MSQISLKDFYKVYDKNVEVIKHVDLSIEKSEFVVLVGPSGCGKSTMLRMIAGLEDITGGELKFQDQIMNDVNPSERDVAMVFQDYALYPHMTVYENMAFSMRLKKYPKEEIDRRVKEAGIMLDLTEYLYRKPAALSGGQRQRVAMGRAIVKKSNIFLYDEPLSNLDAKLRSKMRGEIKRFHINSGSTSVYVTHDQLEAMTLADKLVVLKDGKIQQCGDPMEVFQTPRNTFVATFIGSPSMNLIDVSVERDGDAVYLYNDLNNFRFSLPQEKKALVKDQKRLIMGIRPSDIFIANDHDNIAPDWKVDGRIEMVELLGKNAYITLTVGDTECIGEVMGAKTPKIGDKANFSFNLNHIHLFDFETKINLLY